MAMSSASANSGSTCAARRSASPPVVSAPAPRTRSRPDGAPAAAGQLIAYPLLVTRYSCFQGLAEELRRQWNACTNAPDLGTTDRHNLSKSIAADTQLLALIRRGDHVSKLLKDLPDAVQAELLREHDIGITVSARLGKAFEAGVARIPKKLTTERDLVSFIARWVISKVDRAQPADPIWHVDAMLAHARPAEQLIDWASSLIQYIWVATNDTPVPAHLRQDALEAIKLQLDERTTPNGGAAWPTWYRAIWCQRAMAGIEKTAESDVLRLAKNVDALRESPTGGVRRVVRLAPVVARAGEQIERLFAALEVVLSESRKVSDSVAKEVEAILAGRMPDAWDPQLSRWAELVANARTQFETSGQRARLEALISIAERVRPLAPARDMDVLRNEVDAIRATLSSSTPAEPKVVAPILTALEGRLTGRASERESESDPLDELSVRFNRALAEGRFEVRTELSMDSDPPAPSGIDDSLPQVGFDVPLHEPDVVQSITSHQESSGVTGTGEDAVVHPDTTQPSEANSEPTQARGDLAAASSELGHSADATAPYALGVESDGASPGVEETRASDGAADTDDIPIGSPVISTRAAPAPARRQMPHDLMTFEKFREYWWVGADGELDVVPWRQANYNIRATAAMAAEFGHSEPSFALLWLMAKASSAEYSNTPPSRGY
jgi:hypothetical protein